MKKYNTPICEIEKFEIKYNILTTSNTNDHFLIHNSNEVEYDDDFEF